MTDWLGRSEAAFAELCEKWVAVFKKPELTATYGWNDDAVVKVMAAIHAFLTARAAYKAADTSDNRNAKNEALKNAKSEVRGFANSSVRFNPNMPDAAKKAMGVRLRDNVPTNRPQPESRPETLVESTSNRFDHKIRAQNRENRSDKKPDDAYGVRYAWQIGGEKPEDAEDLPRGIFKRKTNYTVHHKEADKGKPCFYATRYENGKGDGGPWSAIVEAYIS